MDRNELTEKLSVGYYAGKVLRKLIERAIGESEEIHAFFKPDDQGEEIKEVICYVVTTAVFFRFRISEFKFGWESCHLRSFRSFEEELTPVKGKVRSWDNFLGDDCPGEYKVRLQFYNDNGLGSIEFITDSSRSEEKREELEDFVRGFHKAIASYQGD